jgi:hypothetical protein
VDTNRLAERLPSTSVKLQTLTELAKTQLEWTQFYVGFLTDFFATPVQKTYVSPMVAVVDLVHDTAAIPGKGDTPVTFTHTFDLAKYADRVLDFTEWDRCTGSSATRRPGMRLFRLPRRARVSDIFGTNSLYSG